MVSAGLPTLILGVLCLLVSATSAKRTCPSRYQLIEDECFKLIRTKKTVYEAEQHCESEDAALAAMETLRQKEAVVEYINEKAPGQYWTSGMDMGEKFMWGTTQQEINPRFRGRIFSPNTCVYVCSRTRKFWDRSCDQKLGFICQTRSEFKFDDSIEAF